MIHPSRFTETRSPDTACGCEGMERVVRINGVPIHALSPAHALDHIEMMLACPATHVVNHIPADPIVIAGRDPAFRSALQRADLNLPDGMGVVWAARILGVQDQRQRVYGPDFMLEAMAWGADRGLRHALLGGTPAVLDRLVAVLRAQIPDVEIVSAYSPPIRPVTEAGVAEDLSKLKVDADILWVGLGTPKQQLWADLAREGARARVMSTVGAAFDFLSGTKRQAPQWMQAAGLEWLFRLGVEPQRLWRRYLLGNPKFAAVVARERAMGPRRLHEKC